MTLFFIVLLLLCSSEPGFSQGTIVLQDKPFFYKDSRDTSIWNRLTYSQAFLVLSESEQAFYYWTNLLRKNPTKFNQAVVQEFLKQFPEVNAIDAISLVADLKGAPANLSFLYPDDGLIKMALTHATDLKKRNGIISHQSASGKSFVQRIKEEGRYKCGAENLFVGSPDPLEALVLLLIDQGVKDKGHRRNLLDPTFTLMGASFKFINTKKAILVQEFGCK